MKKTPNPPKFDKSKLVSPEFKERNEVHRKQIMPSDHPSLKKGCK